MREFAGEASFVFHSSPAHKFSLKRLAALTLFGVGFLTATQAEALCVKAAEATLRKGPGTQHRQSWEVFKYMPLESLGRNGRWIQVRDVDGDRHWVHRNLVTTAFRCAVVKVASARVRSGPSTRHPATAISPAEKYYAFRVMSSQGQWVKVQDEVNNQGWIAKDLLWIR